MITSYAEFQDQSNKQNCYFQLICSKFFSNEIDFQISFSQKYLFMSTRNITYEVHFERQSISSQITLFWNLYSSFFKNPTISVSTIRKKMSHEYNMEQTSKFLSSQMSNNLYQELFFVMMLEKKNAGNQQIFVFLLKCF